MNTNPNLTPNPNTNVNGAYGQRVDEKLSTLTLRVSDELRDILKTKARATDRTVSKTLLRYAIAGGLMNNSTDI